MTIMVPKPNVIICTEKYWNFYYVIVIGLCPHTHSHNSARGNDFHLPQRTFKCQINQFT